MVKLPLEKKIKIKIIYIYLSPLLGVRVRV
jgi:hypothetical protein